MSLIYCVQSILVSKFHNYLYVRLSVHKNKNQEAVVKLMSSWTTEMLHFPFMFIFAV